MLNVALIGAGGISQAHLKAWQQVPEARLAAVCDIRPEKADAAARETGATAYYDLDAMLDGETLDALDICLPTYLHADVAVRAMDRGLHVLTEKPLSLRETDVARVYGAAARNGVRFMVAQVLRFWPEYEALRDAWATGKYGRLLSGTMSRLGNTPAWSWDGWMTDPARSGLVPFDLHIHDLDFMVYAFGEPDGVTCHRARDGRQDYLHALYTYGNFFIAAEASWFDTTAFAFHSGYRFQFERAVMDYSGGTLTVYHQGGEAETIGKAATGANGINLPGTNAYYNEIRYFADCCLNGTPCNRVKPQELSAVLRLIEKLDV